MKHTIICGVVGALIGASFLGQAAAAGGASPQPLAGHPGNIFLAGEAVTIAAPPGDAETWQAADYEGRTVAEGRVREGRAELGPLPVGYYEISRAGARANSRVSVGVLERLRAPTPRTSPLGINVAMAWFFPKEKMASVAGLCALAGMNRVRDRLNWPELEPQKGQFAAPNRYDWSVQAQAAAGLQVLETSHHSPAWANPNGKRFPLDLRDAYTFHREMARRWRGQVVAFEPWNEADISMFGGHTGSEMASLQKAAYLGLKAGNPKVVACLNVFATHRPATLRNLRENEAWPYFDTFNLHHYKPFAAYPKLYADFRAVSAGKPLWVTECSVPVQWRGDERLQEPAPEDLRLQGERLTMTYAQAIHEGAEAVFYFMLPHYVEGQTQCGVLRPDLTPRPAFVALAAAGRLLAGAKPLGRLETSSDAVHGFLFAARPDGQRAKLLVVWADCELDLVLSRPPKACLDHLGRPRALSGQMLKLSRAPLFVVLARGTRLPLVPPPEPPKLLPGKPSPLVLQAVLPEETIVLKKSAYNLPAGPTAAIPIFLYNFGAKPLRGRLTASVSLPSANPPAAAPWQIEFPSEAAIAPGERKELPLRLTRADVNAAREATLRITGDFGAGGRLVLVVRFAAAAD